MNSNDHTLFQKHWSLTWPTHVRRSGRCSAPPRLRSVRAVALEEAIIYTHGRCGDERGLGSLWCPASNSPACAGREDPLSFPPGDMVLPQHVLMGCPVDIGGLHGAVSAMCSWCSCWLGVPTITFSFVSHLPLNLPFLFLLTTQQLCIQAGPARVQLCTSTRRWT